MRLWMHLRGVRQQDDHHPEVQQGLQTHGDELTSHRSEMDKDAESFFSFSHHINDYKDSGHRVTSKEDP